MKKEDEMILPDITNIKSQETYTLPSKGLLYTEKDNIPASITLRRMTTKEDKIRMRNSTEDRIKRDLLQACILEDNVDAGNLKLVDANFLLFRLRSLSLLDDTYKIQVRCRNCGTVFIHEINLSEVPIEYTNKEKVKLLKLELPLSKQKVDLKYPSLNNLITTGDKINEYMQRFPQADRDEVVYSIAPTLYIEKVNGQKLMSEELEAWLDGMDIIDSRALRSHLIKLDDLYGFDNDLKTSCPNCNSEVSHGLPITGELFNPSL